MQGRLGKCISHTRTHPSPPADGLRRASPNGMNEVILLDPKLPPPDPDPNEPGPAPVPIQEPDDPEPDVIDPAPEPMTALAGTEKYFRANH